MSNDDGSCWITYNGEFYNHGEFRPRLAAHGVSFRGTSDTETLLRLMEHDGPDALAETAGIFAFGFWDGRKDADSGARSTWASSRSIFTTTAGESSSPAKSRRCSQDPGRSARSRPGGNQSIPPLPYRAVRSNVLPRHPPAARRRVHADQSLWRARPPAIGQ